MIHGNIEIFAECFKLGKRGGLIAAFKCFVGVAGDADRFGAVLDAAIGCNAGIIDQGAQFSGSQLDEQVILSIASLSVKLPWLGHTAMLDFSIIASVDALLVLQGQLKRTRS